MPAPTLDDIRTATETLAELTEYLRENPEPAEALALAEPLLDEYMGLPVQLADTLRALARAVLDHPDTTHTLDVHLAAAELRSAAWEQADQHSLHYVLDDLRTLLDTAPTAGPEGYSCP